MSIFTQTNTLIFWSVTVSNRFVVCMIRHFLLLITFGVYIVFGLDHSMITSIFLFYVKSTAIRCIIPCFITIAFNFGTYKTVIGVFRFY